MVLPIGLILRTS